MPDKDITFVRTANLSGRVNQLFESNFTSDLPEPVSVFKKIFNLLKNMNVKEINFYFTDTGVLLFGVDHLEKNIIYMI